MLSEKVSGEICISGAEQIPGGQPGRRGNPGRKQPGWSRELRGASPAPIEQTTEFWLTSFSLHFHSPQAFEGIIIFVPLLPAIHTRDQT